MRQAAIRAGLKAALAEYQPARYDGETLIISCAKSMKYMRKPRTGWPSIAPRAKIVQIGTAHDEALNGSLPAVGAAVQRFLDQVQPGAAKTGSAAATD